MKTLIVSDLHLTNKFEINKFKYLFKLFSSYDQIIINGDFWDGYLVTIDDFITSGWSRLFPLLKSKNTIYLYGNHDKKEWCKGKESLFSDKQVNQFDIKIHGQSYRLQHGHKLLKSKIHDPNFVHKIPLIILQINKFIFELLPLKIFGIRFNQIYFQLNIAQMEYGLNNISSDIILICGHTHYGLLNFKKRYLNSGFINYGYAQYISINKKGLSLISGRY